MPYSSNAEWVRYARNNLESAIREMTLQCNPRLRAYEIILFNCHQSADAIEAGRGLNSAKRIYDFVSDRLGLGKVYFD